MVGKRRAGEDKLILHKMTETDSKSWVEVIRYDPSPAGGAGGYRVSIYVESTLIEMPYNLPRERANGLA